MTSVWFPDHDILMTMIKLQQHIHNKNYPAGRDNFVVYRVVNNSLLQRHL